MCLQSAARSYARSARMLTAWFTFDTALVWLLPRSDRQGRIRVGFKGRQSVKHLMEALGVPHTEAGTVMINGAPGSLGQIARDEDEIIVWPAVRRPTLPARFVLDGHLGRLAAYLRMLGFDTWYRSSCPDEELARLAGQDRVLISRDRRLLMRKGILQGYCVRSLKPVEQVHEVLARFDLVAAIVPFRRCIRCNGVLEVVDKAVIRARLKPLTARYYFDFRRCPDCEQIYWKGSHHEKMIRFIHRLHRRANATSPKGTAELE